MNVSARDIPWTGTGGLSDSQSYSHIILNAIYDRLSSSSLFVNFPCKRISSALQIQSDIQIPFIGVFLGEENMTPDGDLNAGDIRFEHLIQIGIQIVVKNNDPVAMQALLDRASWFALNQLLRDNSFTNRLTTSLPDNVTIEGVPRVYFRPDVWGTTTGMQETPVGERCFWFTFKLRSEWYPTDFPELERITVTTAFPIGGDTAGVEQVKIVHEFNPDSVPTPLPPDPTLTSISPTTAVAGTATLITATGTDFDSTATIVIGDAPEVTTVVSSTELTATVPDTLPAGSYDVVVINNVGAMTDPQVLTLT
jgi:hypothetical protein